MRNRSVSPSKKSSALSRRNFLGALGGSIALAALRTGMARPALAESKFTMGVPGGTFGEALKRSFVTGSQFEQRYSVSIEYLFRGNPVGMSKILGECGHPSTTVSMHEIDEAVLMADSECIVGYNPELVPNYKYSFPPLKGQSSRVGPYYATFVIAAMGLVWNTKLAKRPGSWKDMWSAQYKGKVGVPAYDWQGIYWLHAVNKLFGGDEDNITPGIQAAADLVKKNNAVIIKSVDQGVQMFTREEIVIAPFWNGRTTAFQDRGMPFAIEYVQNSFSNGLGFVVPRGTAYPELAQRFVNETLDGRNQLDFAKTFLYPPGDTRVKLPPDLEKIAIPPKAQDRFARFNWRKVALHTNDYLERWNKEVLG